MLVSAQAKVKSCRLGQLPQPASCMSGPYERVRQARNASPSPTTAPPLFQNVYAGMQVDENEGLSEYLNRMNRLLDQTQQEHAQA